MKINAEQYSAIMAELRTTRAALKAVEAQLAEVMGRIAKVIEGNADTNARISFQRRPKP